MQKVRIISGNDFITQDDMYDELPFWSAPFGLKLLEKVIPAKAMKVLDIGYGTGFPLIEIAMRLGESCQVYGIDPDPLTEEITSKKLKSFNITNAELIKGIAEQILFPDNFFDLVVSNNGLNNTKYFAGAISECARVLKSGGKLIFTMNLEGTMIEFYSIMKDVLIEHRLWNSISSMQAHIHQKRRPVEEVLSILEQHGLAVVSSENNQFHYYFTDGDTLFRHHFIRSAFYPAWEAIVPKHKRNMIFKEIQSKINKIGAEKGYFSLTIPFIVIDAVKNYPQ